MYIGKDLLFPESDIYVLKNSETLQVVYSPIRFENNAQFVQPTTFGQIDANHINTQTLYVSGTSTFVGLITGTITKARWS